MMTRRHGPLTESYPAAVALVVFALVPFLLLTGAMLPLAPLISKSLHLSTAALDIAIGLSDAGYALGTVLAVQFAVHLPARRMLLGYVSAFLVAAVLAAWAPNGPVFIGAFIAEGLCTSLMLIAAVPPLVTGWPVRKMPWTGMIMNLCIFGAVAIGPTVGELQAATGSWRPLLWVVAGVAGLALLFAVLTFEDQPAQDRSAPWDLVAIGLASAGCAAAFFGAARLETSRVNPPGTPRRCSACSAAGGQPRPGRPRRSLRRCRAWTRSAQAAAARPDDRPDQQPDRRPDERAGHRAGAAGEPRGAAFTRGAPTRLSYGAVAAYAFWLYAFGPALALLRAGLTPRTSASTWPARPLLPPAGQEGLLTSPGLAPFAAAPGRKRQPILCDRGESGDWRRGGGIPRRGGIRAVDLPVPGSGRTWERWLALADLAGEDLSLARLGEGHPTRWPSWPRWPARHRQPGSCGACGRQTRPGRR